MFLLDTNVVSDRGIGRHLEGGELAGGQAWPRGQAKSRQPRHHFPDGSTFDVSDLLRHPQHIVINLKRGALFCGASSAPTGVRTFNPWTEA